MRLLLPTLGVNVFAVESPTAPSPSGLPEDAVVLELKWEDARAECVVHDGQFTVRSGSTARVKEVDSLADGPRGLRRTLRQTGDLVPRDGASTLFQFTQDYAFDSPSASAAVVSGTGLNGRAAWKLKGQAISYKEWQEAQVNAAGATDAQE